MDGPALATHSELGNRAGVADRGRCEHRPEWLDRAESFPAGRSDRIGIADTLRSAAQPRGRRLEAGRSAGCVHGTGIAGRSVAGIDLRSRSDGAGVYRGALWDSLETGSCGLECWVRYDPFFEGWPPKPAEPRLRKPPPSCR